MKRDKRELNLTTTNLRSKFYLTISTQQTETDSFANSVDPIEPSHLDPQCLAL